MRRSAGLDSLTRPRPSWPVPGSLVADGMGILLACLYFFGRNYGLQVSETTSNSLSARSVLDGESDPCAARSVWDVLWSCLATTSAVTWVSVHPNVPVLDETDRSVLRRRLFLMLLALIAPEIMILWAFKQWRGAKEIKRIINDARPESVRPWTMVHAHFLQMGGFRLVCTKEENVKGPIDSSLSVNVEFAGSRILTAWGKFFIPYYLAFQSALNDDFVEGALTFPALLGLLESKRIDLPELSEADIHDKSKGDALSKGFALLQISWFLLQVFSRAGKGLVVTELELTTAVLAGLNVVTYVFWWSKPVDVRCPVVVRTRAVEEVMHARLMKEAQDWKFSDGEEASEEYEEEDGISSISTVDSVSEKVPQASSSAELPKPFWSTSVIFSKFTSPVFKCFHRLTTSIHPASTSQLPSTRKPARRYDPLAFRQRTRTQRALHWIMTHILRPPTHLLGLLITEPANTLLEHGLWNIGASSTDDESHNVANEFYLEHYADARHKLHTKPTRELLMHAGDMRWVMAMLFYSERPLTRDTTTTATSSAHSSAIDPRKLFYAGACAGAAFGALHCIAWSFPFPSVAERTTWRASALLIVALCLIVLLGAQAYRLAHAGYWRADPGSDRSRACLAVMLLLPKLAAIPCVLYPLARIALLIVAFTSLRNLSESALQTVQWTRFIPHI